MGHSDINESIPPIMKRNNILKWVLVSVAVILLLGWFLVPLLVKNYAINNSKELLGRQIDMERLRFNYFTGNMHMTGFKMFEPDEQTVFVSFDTLNLNIEPYQFIFNKKVVEELYLQGLFVNIVQQDSTFNFDDLVAFHKAEDESEAEDPEEEEAFKYILSNLELKDAQFVYEDRNLPDTTRIEDFSFFIPQISWDQEEKSNADIRFNFKEEGYLESSLNINPVDGEYDAQINIYRLGLSPFIKRIQEYAEVTSVEGYLDTGLVIYGNVNEVEKSVVTGTAKVYELSMTDSNSKEFLSSETVTCTLKEIDYHNSSYHIDSLSILSPYLFFELDSTSNNLFRIFKVEEEDSTETSPSASEDKLFYAINHLSLQKGVVDYTDNLTGQPFNYHLSEIQIETDSIFSDAEWVEINSQMLLNDRGTLVARAGYDPVDYLAGQLDISVEKFLLPDLNIYTNHYTGHALLNGDMYYYSNSKLTDGNLESENQLILKQPTLRDGEGGLYRLPLKLALWLLSDSNGDVTLNVPVRGDLNDPEIDVWKLIWVTLKKKVTDTADNPVQSLAPLVDADPNDLRAIEFEYTDSLPSEHNRQQMDWLLKLEKKKAGLSIDLEYFVDDELQRQALAEISEKKSDTTETTESSEQSASEELSRLYSEARFRNIRKYLDSLSSDTRIHLKDRDSIAPQNTGALPNFKIKFALSKTDSLSN
ncbi:MAG: DUF748 domain-containing protein [Lutimonas sp.]